jgi:diguanylate cyclase (GGDEF)-like protein
MVLSVHTLFVVFIINFLALALVWTYVVRSYPSFEAARYWCAASFVASMASAMSLLRGLLDPFWPMLLGSGLFIFACCIGAMGIQRFYGKPASWWLASATTTISFALLGVLGWTEQGVALRIAVFSIGQSLPLVLALPLLLSHKSSPGARLAGFIIVITVLIHAVRFVASFMYYAADATLSGYSSFQAAMVVLLVFSAMCWNFGFLLMAIDRLREEVANLALHDDLTGVANRRQLFARLESECRRSGRTAKPFALLAFDLDGFKAINDRHGHAAGDECLRVFSQRLKARLRTTDLLARCGGDEFFVLMPDTSLQEAGRVAEELVLLCRSQIVHWFEQAIPLSTSIGVAEWTRPLRATPEAIMLAADQALYIAKDGGRDRAVLAPRSLPLRLSA